VFGSQLALIFELEQHQGLGFRGAAPTCNAQHKKKESTVEKTQIGNGIAAGGTQERWNPIQSCEKSKDQREDRANQT
jgi:hypothetical protein